MLAAARRMLDAGFCCGVEVEEPSAPGERWQPHLIALSTAAPEQAREAVLETIAWAPGRRVRLSAYSRSGLTRAGGPAPVVWAPAR